MQRRELLLGAGAAVVANGRLAAPALSAEPKTLIHVPQASMATLDPVWTTAVVTRNAGAMLFETLYGRDERLIAQPQMVEGHVVENDGRTWKLTLRDGLRFHDNTPVLARDAAACIIRWMQTDAFGQNLRAATDELSAASDKVIQFRLKRPFPLLPAALAKPSAFCPVMPERLASTPVNSFFVSEANDILVISLSGSTASTKTAGHAAPTVQCVG